MFERPSAVNDPASVEQVLQPLQGSAEQAAPPTASKSQAGATSGTTASGDNASQSSSQENATGTNVSNNTTVNFEVYSYNVLALYPSRGLLVISCCPTLRFLVYVFSRFAGAGLKFRAWSTWSVIYSFELAFEYEIWGSRENSSNAGEVRTEFKDVKELFWRLFFSFVRSRPQRSVHYRRN